MARELPREMEKTERAAAGTGSRPVSRPEFVPSKPEPKWVERKAPVRVEFDGVGSHVQGVLMAAETIEIQDKETHQKKRVVQYLIRDGADAYEFIGTWDMNKKLSARDVGCMVRITFIGENKEVQKGKNFLRIFQVLIVQKSEQDEGRPEITDADIPF